MKKDVINLVTFHTGEMCCGIEIHHVQEINKLFEITPVPNAPNYVTGVLNLRGEIITIIDLAKKLEIDSLSISESNRNIIVRSGDEYIALFVERVGDVVQGNQDDIEPPPANAGNAQRKFFKGVLKKNSLLIGILDIEEVIK